MNKFLFLIVTVVGLSISNAFAKTWDMALPYGDGTHHTQVARSFAQEVNNKANGELNIKVHSGGSLIKHPEIHRAVKSRQVPIGEIFIGRLGNVDPIFKLDNIPFLATNFDDAKKLYKASKKELNNQLNGDGLMLLYASPWPAQDLYTNKYVRNLSDLKGVKMRSYSPTTSKLAKLMNTTPANVPYSDVAQAFATNAIGAMITSPSTGVNSQSWDYIKYLNTVNAWIPKNMVVVNKKVFDRLDNKIKQIILAAAKNAEIKGWTLGKKLAVEHTNILRDNGMIVTQPTSQLNEELSDIAKQMLQDWLDEAGDEGKKIINNYRFIVD